MTNYGSPVWPDNHKSNDLDIDPAQSITDEMVEQFIAAFDPTSLSLTEYNLPKDIRCRCDDCLTKEKQVREDVRVALAAVLTITRPDRKSEA